MDPSRTGKTTRNRRIAFVQFLLTLCCAFTLPFARAGEFTDVSALQQEIDAAQPGAHLVIDGGVYRGNLVIDKPLTLEGRNRPMLDGVGRGHTLEISAEEVTITGWIITNSGSDLSQDTACIYVTGNQVHIADNRIIECLHGVYLKKVEGALVEYNVIRGKESLPLAPTAAEEGGSLDGAELCSPLNVNIRGNGIHLWNSRDCQLTGNDISNTRDGMYFSFTDSSEVRDNYTHQVRYGLHYMYSDNNLFENNLFEDSAAGAAIMYSKNLIIRDNRFVSNSGMRAYGLLLNSVDNSLFERNHIDENSVGIYLENCNSNTFLSNTVERNSLGLRLTGSSYQTIFARNTIVGNLRVASLAGQSPTNRWSVGGEGNYWGSDSGLLDLDLDGISELPRREVDFYANSRKRFPAVSLLSGSAGVSFLELIYRLIPFGEFEAIEDPDPLIYQP